ncbi:MAG TPA: F420-dependent NADP oxidoreductase [Mucilaginibacter sp.]|nr:F420-dependent NADP oxidoreductase [Mucilaginibacter sp.]
MRITIIGSGNVATHLAAAFKNAGHNIVQVYSRDMQHAAMLAYHVKAEPIDDLDSINHATDIFIISIKDDAIRDIAKKLAKYDAVIAHTSGATSLQDIMAYTDKAGVLYPLQTFSKTRELDFRTVPLCIEGATEEITSQLIDLGRTISNHVYRVDSGQRKILHMAAVFACNFPNYLYYAARQLLQQHNLDFNMLRPLILETAEKVQEHLPVNVQTGPAIRNDEKTMAAHLQLLQDNPELQDLYRQISQLIIKMDKGGHAGV